MTRTLLAIALTIASAVSISAGSTAKGTESAEQVVTGCSATPARVLFLPSGTVRTTVYATASAVCSQQGAVVTLWLYKDGRQIERKTCSSSRAGQTAVCSSSQYRVVRGARYTASMQARPRG